MGVLAFFASESVLRPKNFVVVYSGELRDLAVRMRDSAGAEFPITYVGIPRGGGAVYGFQIHLNTVRGNEDEAAARRLIQSGDTFFIATGNSSTAKFDAILEEMGQSPVYELAYADARDGSNFRIVSNRDTISLMPSEEYMFISSRMIKEIAQMGGDIRQFVPPSVAERLAQKLASA